MDWDLELAVSCAIGIRLGIGVWREMNIGLLGWMRLLYQLSPYPNPCPYLTTHNHLPTPSPTAALDPK